MPKAKTSKRRTQTKKLPARKKELTKNQQKKVKGGLKWTLTTPLPTVTMGSPVAGVASMLLDSEKRANA